MEVSGHAQTTQLQILTWVFWSLTFVESISFIASRMKWGIILKLAKFELRVSGTSEFFLYLNFSSDAYPPSSSEVISHKVLKFKINILREITVNLPDIRFGIPWLVWIWLFYYRQRIETGSHVCSIHPTFSWSTHRFEFSSLKKKPLISRIKYKFLYNKSLSVILSLFLNFFSHYWIWFWTFSLFKIRKTLIISLKILIISLKIQIFKNWKKR